MKSRSGVLLSCATGALLIGLAPVMPAALAADMVVKAEAPVELPWWTHGFLEVGGRGFLNDPTYGGHIYQGQGSLAKYYEYSTVKPGPFADFFVAAGSGNGLYEVDVWGKNVGYSDQRYDAYLSKAGEQYFNFMWDQTPHVYSTSASTLFNTNGNALTLINPNIGTQMFNAGGVGFPTIPNAATPASTAKTNAISTIINQNVVPTNVGIRRDTAAVEYRYTPTDNWDIRANYSNMRRTGSQVDGVLFTDTNTGSRVEVAKPIADTTQNFGVNGEYAGTSAWGKKFNVMVGYNGSVYQDDFNNYTVQNPFCSGLVCAGNGNATTPLAMMSTPPNNQKNGVSSTLGADLPLNSRYMGTVSYSGMRQNDAFIPFASTGIPGLTMNNGLPAAALSTIPAIVRTQGGVGVTSLNGSINTLLVNNVVTTQITPDLKTKVSYRYYDYSNQTPELHLSDWIIADAASTITSGHAVYAPVNTLSLGYIKQNGGAEATWRPVNSVNIGGAYGYERYDWTRADASSTTENSGKVYADWKPTSWITARTSAFFSERRAGNYDYLNNVGFFQWPAPTSATHPSGDNYTAYYRQFYLDDRDRAQGKFAVDVNVLRNLTVTPTFNIKNDTYIFGQNQVGVTSDRSYAAGVEAAYVATPDATFLFSYMNEQRSQNVLTSNTQLAPQTATLAYSCPTPITCQLSATSVRDNVNTFIVGMNYAVIPQKFDLHVGYTLSKSTNSQPLFFSNGTGPASGGYPSLNAAGVANPGQFPNVNATFQRVDFTGKYIVDKDFVTSLGLKGEVALKFRYAWERNSVANWNNDTMQPYMYTAMMNQPQAAYVQWMAGNNPNYNVHLLGAAVAFAW
jgi:hypothetical protein